MALRQIDELAALDRSVEVKDKKEVCIHCTQSLFIEKCMY